MVMSAEVALEPAGQGGWPWITCKNPFRYFKKTSPEIIQLGALIYVRFPLALRDLPPGKWSSI
jgi:hypothetical protein